MIRQSEIANFLDLIKHISQTRELSNHFKSQKKKKKHRYQQQAQSYERRANTKSLNDQQLEDNIKKQIQFEHKMLKISHDIKRRPRSIKIDPFSSTKINIQSQLEKNDKNKEGRPNLFENYCEIMHRRRQQKISKIFRGNSEHYNNSPVYDIASTVQFQKDSKVTSLNQSPLIKSKTVKQGVQLGRPRKMYHAEQHLRQYKPKKQQPQELNIQAMNSHKMPKIIQPDSNISEKRIKLKSTKFRIENHEPIIKNRMFNKLAKLELEGWTNQEERGESNVDFF